MWDILKFLFNFVAKFFVELGDLRIDDDLTIRSGGIFEIVITVVIFGRIEILERSNFGYNLTFINTRAVQTLF